MPSVNQDTARWDERIARARELASEQESAREVLTFYAGLADHQRSLSRTSPGAVEPTSDFADCVDLDAASAAVPEFLRWLQRTAPAPLAVAAADLPRIERREWRQRMHRDLTEDAHDRADSDDAALFVVEAVLQPFAEATAIAWRRDRGPEPRASSDGASRCPVCSGPPVVGILREEGQGARRMLLCARCLTEWKSLRVWCPACDEQRFDALPIYTADSFPHARIDACDTCKRYVKTIDLTKNALAVPLVDDMASLPLDLWAREQGYRRLHANLLRTAEGALASRVKPVS